MNASCARGDRRCNGSARRPAGARWSAGGSGSGVGGGNTPGASIFLEGGPGPDILAGVLLLDLIRLPSRGGGISGGLQGRAERWGIWGGGLLGLVFALSFCPTSAALFFGSLIPLAVKSGSSVILPSVYGIGTAIPVFAFAIALATGVNAVGRMFHVLTRFEVWARRITGVIFIVVGGYYCLTYIFGVFV